MRDPKRIRPALERLRSYWLSHPDLRLGQIIVNAASEVHKGISSDAFYIEDDQLIQAVMDMWKEEQI